jgi:hypothetical protein
MKSRFVAPIVFSLAFFAAGCASTDTVPQNPAAVSTAKPATALNGPLPTLRLGMTAEEVQRIVGQPEEIKPFDSTAGRGETWTYRRVIGESTAPEAVSTTRAAAFNGLPDHTGSEPVMQYRLKRTVTYQETTLLIFDGKLVSSKQRIEQSVSYGS